MEKPIKYWYAMSNQGILQVIGTFIQETRLQQNKTQQQVAEAAGINRSTLVQIEKGGGGTLLTFIQVLRALEQLHLLYSFEKSQQISPLQLAKLEMQKRQRARKKKKDDSKPKTEW